MSLADVAATRRTLNNNRFTFEDAFEFVACNQS